MRTRTSGGVGTEDDSNLAVVLGYPMYAPHGRELEDENPLRKDPLLEDYTTVGNR
jgi:hypothetical protein